MLVEGFAPRFPAPPRPGARDPQGTEVRRHFRFVRGLSLRSVFMELGAGDCPVARHAAGHVERAYAAGAAEALLGARAPNLVPVASDGVVIPVPEATVDAALSNRLLERLHPRDALEHLRSVRRALRRGGRYCCITGHRLCAPKAPGLYLFGAAGLRELFAEAGFRRIRFYARIGGVYAELPYWLLRAAEGLLGAVPYRLRRALAGNAVARALLGLYAEALN